MTGFDIFSFEVKHLSLMFEGASCSGNTAVAHRQLTTILQWVQNRWDAPIGSLDII